MVKQFFVLIILTLVSSSALALTSQELVEKCTQAMEKLPESETNEKAIKRFLDTGTCGGYIGGVVAGINLVGSMLMQQEVLKKNFICSPKGLHAQHLVQMLVNYVKANSKMRQEPAQLVIYQMLHERYPC